MPSSSQNFNNTLRGLETIKENYPGILAATLCKDDPSFSTLLKLKFQMERDILNDCVYCLIQSEEGTEFMEDKDFEFDYENEYFVKRMDFNFQDGAMILTEIIQLISILKTVPQRDTEYFSENEKQAVEEEITELLGE